MGRNSECGKVESNGSGGIIMKAPSSESVNLGQKIKNAEKEVSDLKGLLATYREIEYNQAVEALEKSLPDFVGKHFRLHRNFGLKGDLYVKTLKIKKEKQTLVIDILQICPEDLIIQRMNQTVHFDYFNYMKEVSKEEFEKVYNKTLKAINK